MGKLVWHRDSRYQSAYYAILNGRRFEVWYDGNLKLWTIEVKTLWQDSLFTDYAMSAKLAKSDAEKLIGQY